MDKIRFAKHVSVSTGSCGCQQPENKNHSHHIYITTALTFITLHTSTEHETNMLPTTLDEAGSNRSNDLQVESGSYITLHTREMSTNSFLIN